MTRRQKLWAAAAACALIASTSPAYADNYTAKDGNGSFINFAAKLLGGFLYPFHVAMGLVNGTGNPQALSVDTSGNLNANGLCLAASSAPTYTAGANPLSCDLSGNLRTSSGSGSGTTATAASSLPTLSAGVNNLYENLSGEQFVHDTSLLAAVNASATPAWTLLGLINEAVTTSSAAYALPVAPATGQNVWIINNGANAAYYNLGTTSGVTASLTTSYVAASSCAPLLLQGSNTYIAFIGAASSSVQVQVGTGVPLGCGGGGGGGSSGAVTVASGADVIEGATSDTSATNTVFGNLQAIKANSAATGYIGTTGVVPATGSTVGTVGINSAAAATVQLVAASAGKGIYVNYLYLMTAGTVNVTFEYGTGTNCGTGTTAIGGALPLSATNPGSSNGNGGGAIIIIPASQELCMVTSAATQLSGWLTYEQH